MTTCFPVSGEPSVAETVSGKHPISNPSTASPAVPGATAAAVDAGGPPWVRAEAVLLASYATHSRDTAGREYLEPEHPYRGPFQRDRDRILHSSAFRRLAGKMQVFTGEMGDYHRTRLTHTFEVASIARTIARVLRLNEDLTEALALMHDIGHPPFGHCGEDVLNQCLGPLGGFSHNRFALVIARELEQRQTSQPGMNLSAEVLEGQNERAEKHHGGVSATARLEVQIVDIADSLAYDAHDVDDALQIGLLTMPELQRVEIIGRVLETTHDKYGAVSGDKLRRALVHELIDLQVNDFLQQASMSLQAWQGQSGDAVLSGGVQLEHSRELTQQRQELEVFLFQHVYRHPRLMTVRQRAADRVRQIFETLQARPDRLPARFRRRAEEIGLPASIGQYVAGMTDRFCELQYECLVDGTGQLADW